MSTLLLIVPVISGLKLLYRICYLLSQLLLKRCEVCRGDRVCSQVCCVCGYRCCRCPTLAFGDFRALPLVASLKEAPLPCQMDVCFVAILSQTEVNKDHCTNKSTRRARQASRGEVCVQIDKDTHQTRRQTRHTRHMKVGTCTKKALLQRTFLEPTRTLECMIK